MTHAEEKCFDIYTKNFSLRCDFVHNTSNCQSGHGFFNYVDFLFCTYEATGIPYGTVAISAVILFFLFIGLAVTADDFLCPSLVVITKTLKLSQNIAGVTFLAFGNGAPDIFSSLAGISEDKPQMVIGTLFGAGIFVTTVVAGSIFLTKPFKITERPFLRDIIFYICATFWAFYRFYSGKFTLWHAIGFIALYCLYILVVVLGRIIYQRSNPNRISDEDLPSETALPRIEVDPPAEGITFQNKPHDDDDPEAAGVVLRRFSFRSGSVSGPDGRRRSFLTSRIPQENRVFNISGRVDQNPNPPTSEKSDKPPPLDTQTSKTSLSSLLSKSSEDNESQEALRELFYHVCPIDYRSWPERHWYERAIDVFKSPAILLLKLTVPVMDYEQDKNNWCRSLNSFHCISTAILVVVSTQSAFIYVNEVFPVGAIVLLICSVLAVAVFFTSKNSEPPPYHWVFGYLGFVGSVCWIYTIANEIVALLAAVGVALQISDAILGLTVLAWGNSIGDFISNLSIARQGYPRMGLSACYGGPLLNLLLGMGIPYTIQLANDPHGITIDYSSQVTLLYGTLCVSLVTTMITMTVMKFRTNRWIGIFLLTLYCVFLVSAILLESKVI